MRIVIVGASPLGIATASILLKRGHEVVIVEQDKEKIEALRERLDCGFLHGDGSKPAILREAGPTHTDFLLCVTNSDRDNILAGLVGRSLGYRRVVPKLEDAEFEHICIELGLNDAIVPDHATARALVEMMAGRDVVELSTFIRGELRFFSFIARESDEGLVTELKLPERCAVMCVYHGDSFVLPGRGKTRVVAGDEVVLVTHSENLESLHERWQPVPPQNNGASVQAGD